MTRVLLVGYGDFGSRFASWLEKEGVEISGVVEPLEDKVNGFERFRSLADLRDDVLDDAVIVDASSEGQGMVNVGTYLEMGVPVVFQSGEPLGIAPTYHPEDPQGDKMVRIPSCSGTMAIRLVSALSGLAGIDYVRGVVHKTFSTRNLHDLHYERPRSELEELFGLSCNITKMYQAGAPYNGYVYKGVYRLGVSEEVPVANVLDALSEGRDLRLVHESFDEREGLRCNDTLVLREGVDFFRGELEVPVISFSPELTFAENMSAVRYLSDK